MGIEEGGDGVIVANASEKHYITAHQFLSAGFPVLVEKPITLHPAEAWDLVSLGGIAFAGHTRLYSPAWREFKPQNVRSVQAFAGGTDKDPWWDWGPHLVAMCLDIGFDPAKAEITVTREKQPLRFIADGREFRDVETDPMPLEVLVGEFCQAIKLGQPNNNGLRLGARVIDHLWRRSELR